MQKSNGRINLTEPIKYQFQIFSNPETNQCTSYDSAMTGNWYNTLLSTTFFSVNNIKILQNGIRKGVYDLSKGRYIIGEQDCNNLKTIMRSIFLQNSANNKENIKGQIEALNTLVLNFAVPRIFKEVESYKKYLNDVSTLAVPEQRPVSTDIKGSKVIEFKSWF
jgi:hypothetical protein